MKLPKSPKFMFSRPFIIYNSILLVFTPNIPNIFMHLLFPSLFLPCVQYRRSRTEPTAPHEGVPSMPAAARLPSSVWPKDSGVWTNAARGAETFLNSSPMSKSALKLLRSPATCASAAQQLAPAQHRPGRPPRSLKALQLCPNRPAELHSTDFLK